MKKRLISIMVIASVITSSMFLNSFALNQVGESENNDAVATEMTVDIAGAQDEETGVGDETPIAPALNASSEEGVVNLNWNAFEGATVVDYSVYVNGEKAAATCNEDEGVVSTSLKGLTQGKKYIFQVKWDGTEFATAEATVAVDYVTPAAPKNLKAYPDYNSVTLKWSKVKDAREYKVYKSGKYVKTVTSTTTRMKSLAKNTKYSFKVCAVNGTKTSAYSDIVRSKSVRTMYYNVYPKFDRKLTCHCSGHSYTKTFKKGAKIVAEGYGAGRYMFYYKANGKTHKFYIARLTVTNTKADYMKTTNYSKTSAENFVNHKGLSSRTKYLVWCSYNTQHLYVFKGSKGNWSLVKSWECSTGKSWAPSPSGMKKIWQKVSYRHKLPWWSSYSSWNSFHGKQSDWPLGVPKASGCIRLNNNDAKWVYDNVPVGTTSLHF